MPFNKYLPFAVIYFFLNAVGLPFGLTWTTLLAPFFYYWIVVQRKKELLFPFLLLLLPFVIQHWFFTGIDRQVYLLSLINLSGVYIFCQAVYTFLKRANEPETVFRFLLQANFVLCLVAILFYFTPWDHIFWISQKLTTGISGFRRLKMFTYEASHYACLFIPVFFFFLLQFLFRQHTIKKSWLLPMLFLPFVLSFSMGVIGAALLAGVVTTIIHFNRLLVKRRVLNAVVNVIAVSLSGLVLLVLFFRNNPLFTRLLNIFGGADSSAKGRTANSFILARRMLEDKNEWWGIGLGQVKLAGHDIVQSYYLYNMEFVATIPNAMAETLAIFGWTGFCLKLLIEAALFFLTKVWSNYYRLLLFFFVFVYQFTGSFITNAAEYVIWILAFTNVFRQFDVKIHKAPATASSITAS